jgi:septum formation protein
MTTTECVLGSRSPRRRALLSLIVPADEIRVLPPLDATEPGFNGITTQDGILQQLQLIARRKHDDVRRQLDDGAARPGVRARVITADTTIVARDRSQNPVVLGKPPQDATYRETVHHWFSEYLIGKCHSAITAFCASDHRQAPVCHTVETRVTFRSDVMDCVDWYLETGEPRDKAGGYAIQGAGSLFVAAVDGSLSNVVGLPLAEVRSVFEYWNNNDTAT